MIENISAVDVNSALLIEMHKRANPALQLMAATLNHDQDLMALTILQLLHSVPAICSFFSVLAVILFPSDFPHLHVSV